MKNTKHQPKKTQIDTIIEDEECSLYTLMCVKSVFMLKKFVENYGDYGRRMLLDVKYKLSNCPLTYGIIRDIVKDSSNWEVSTLSDTSNVRIIFVDKINNIRFNLYNHSTGIERGYGSDANRYGKSKFEVDRIKLYYNGNHEMFNDNEKIIVAKVLYTHTEMLKKYEELKIQQKIIKDYNKLRGLY